MHIAVGINGSQAARQDLDLGLAELAVQRMELAVDVADANVIQIDESQLANAGHCQGFDLPGANPDDTRDPLYQKMHNKFGIFDGKMVETGSFNYSPNAEKNSF